MPQKVTSMSEGTPDARPLILISNDDGVFAPGIKALANAMTAVGNCIVVAPSEEQSGVSHAITIRHPVRAHAVPFEVDAGPLEAYSVSGTPVDCVKLAIDQLLPRMPDLVVSGINQGPNAAINTIYSGTVSAALEGAILGVNSIAFSLNAWSDGDFDAGKAFVQRIARSVLTHRLPQGVLLNVNIPDLPAEDIKGIAVTRQAESRWQESFVERIDPMNRPYYWIAGEFVDLDEGDDTDLAALRNGLIPVTPIRPDLTAHDMIGELKGLDF